MAQQRQRAPSGGFKPPGARLWGSVIGLYDLDEHELALLVEACRTVDLLDELDAAIRRDGALIETPQGLHAHPAAVEARQQRSAHPGRAQTPRRRRG